jgi:hypothetical protein
MSIGDSSLAEARLAMLAFAALLWFIAWSLRFLPTPIKNPVKRAAIQLVLATTVGANSVGQVMVYRALSGIRVLGENKFFIVAFLIEHVIALCLMFSSAFERRRQERNERRARL